MFWRRCAALPSVRGYLLTSSIHQFRGLYQRPSGCELSSKDRFALSITRHACNVAGPLSLYLFRKKLRIHELCILLPILFLVKPGYLLYAMLSPKPEWWWLLNLGHFILRSLDLLLFLLRGFLLVLVSVRLHTGRYKTVPTLIFPCLRPESGTLTCYQQAEFLLTEMFNSVKEIQVDGLGEDANKARAKIIEARRIS